MAVTAPDLLHVPNPLLYPNMIIVVNAFFSCQQQKQTKAISELFGEKHKPAKEAFQSQDFFLILIGQSKF